MKNQKKLGVIIMFLIIVAIIIGIVIFVMNNNHNEEPKIDVDKPEFSSETIKQVVENSYKIAYLLHGDVKVAEGYIMVDEVPYYALDDEKLSSFKSIKDISALIMENFEENFAAQYISDLFNENNNNYFEFEGKIYVRKTATPCEFVYDYNENDSFNINKQNEKKYQVTLNNIITVWVYKNENTYKMAQIGFYCQE